MYQRGMEIASVIRQQEGGGIAVKLGIYLSNIGVWSPCVAW
jgi:hypothetical protein